MERRPIKELLILLKEEMIKRTSEKINTSSHGICYYIISLRLNDEMSNSEYFILDKYIKNNRPDKETHEEFTKNELYQNSSVYFWKPITLMSKDSKELQIRLKFLDRLIELA